MCAWGEDRRKACVAISNGMTSAEVVALLGEPSRKATGGEAIVIKTGNYHESEYLEKYTEDEVGYQAWQWFRPEAGYTVFFQNSTMKVSEARVRVNPFKYSYRCPIAKKNLLYESFVDVESFQCKSCGAPVQQDASGTWRHRSLRVRIGEWLEAIRAKSK